MRLVVLLDQFPALSETFVADEIAALRRLGHEVRVEAAARPREAAVLADPPPVCWLEDDTHARRVRDLAWLAVRRPGAVLADLRAQRRWRRVEHVRPLRVLAPLVRRLARSGETHVHVHFAGPAALDGRRLAGLAGVHHSVIAHAYEIYRAPANLADKLADARPAAGVCGATVADLRALVPQARVEPVVMGVDGERFRRRRPYPGGRHVMAVGRLVEKKGFVHLLEAAARLASRGEPLDALTLVGDGPLRPALEARAAALGLHGVRFTGAVQPEDVRALLEKADVLAVPSVIAADGDRDALPVVVGEALAMEVPVVASDLAGLPEVVHPPWGQLVPPGDGEALAAALADLLGLPAAERARLGRQARAWVLEHRSWDEAARRLSGLLAQSMSVR